MRKRVKSVEATALSTRCSCIVTYPLRNKTRIWMWRDTGNPVSRSPQRGMPGYAPEGSPSGGSASRVPTGKVLRLRGWTAMCALRVRNPWRRHARSMTRARRRGPAREVAGSLAVRGGAVACRGAGARTPQYAALGPWAPSGVSARWERSRGDWARQSRSPATGRPPPGCAGPPGRRASLPSLFIHSACVADPPGPHPGRDPAPCGWRRDLLPLLGR